MELPCLASCRKQSLCTFTTYMINILISRIIKSKIRQACFIHRTMTPIYPKQST